MSTTDELIDDGLPSMDVLEDIEEAESSEQVVHSQIGFGKKGMKRQRRKERKQELKRLGLTKEATQKKEELEFTIDNTKDYESMDKTWNDEITFEQVEKDALKLLEENNRFGEQLSEEEQLELEEKAAENWNVFYSRHQDKFFKDRNYLDDVWEELFEESDFKFWQDDPERQVHVMEVGCGAGNTVFPQIKLHPRFHFYAFDCSENAVDCVKNRSEYSDYYPDRLDAFVCDIAADGLPKELIKDNMLDITTMIFVLSAIHPDKFDFVLKEIFNATRPGGVVLFRDYGLYDLSMMRYKKGHKLADNFFVRGDGTRTYYFRREEVEDMFTRAGFIMESNQYVVREMVNRKRKISMKHVWMNSKFRRPRDHEQQEQQEGEQLENE